MKDALYLKKIPLRCVPLPNGVKTKTPAEDDLPNNNSHSHFYCIIYSQSILKQDYYQKVLKQK